MLTPDHPARTPPWLWPVLTLAATTLLAITLNSFPPSTNSFYPQCPIYTFLHIRCPGCGSTRALAALLTGHIADALRLNALTTCLFPVTVVAAVRHSLRTDTANRPLNPTARRITLSLGFGTAALFTVVRNL